MRTTARTWCSVLLVAVAASVFTLVGPAHAETLSLVRSFGHPGALAYSHDGRLLASSWEQEKNGKRTSGVDIYTMPSGQRIRGFPGGGIFSSLAFSHDGSLLACGGREGVRLWNTRTGRLRATLSGVDCAAFSPDGRTLAAGSDRGPVTLRNPHSLTTIRTIGKKRGGFSSLTFSPDGRFLVGAVGGGGDSGEMVQWDVSTGRERWRRPNSTHDVAYSPNGRWLAGTTGSTVWDARTGSPIGQFLGDTSVFGVAFSPDSGTLAYGHGDYQADPATGDLTLVDVGTHRVETTRHWKGGTVGSVCFSPDGKYLAVAGIQNIQLWRVHRP